MKALSPKVLHRWLLHRALMVIVIAFAILVGSSTNARAQYSGAHGYNGGAYGYGLQSGGSGYLGSLYGSIGLYGLSPYGSPFLGGMNGGGPYGYDRLPIQPVNIPSTPITYPVPPVSSVPPVQPNYPTYSQYPVPIQLQQQVIIERPQPIYIEQPRPVIQSYYPVSYPVSAGPFKVMCFPTGEDGRYGPGSNNPVTWTASVVGGAPPFRYDWVGTDFSQTSGTANSVQVTYRYTSAKSMNATVSSSDGQTVTVSCGSIIADP